MSANSRQFSLVFSVNVEGRTLSISGTRVDGQNATASFQQQMIMPDFDMTRMRSHINREHQLTITVPRLQETQEKMKKTIPIEMVA